VCFYRYHGTQHKGSLRHLEVGKKKEKKLKPFVPNARWWAGENLGEGSVRLQSRGNTVFPKSVPFLTSVGLNRQMTENY
jgi:hypothetical protein